MKLGVSACLVGELCRYNGQGSNDDFVTKTLKNYFHIESYCPEAEVFGTPRETIRLVNVDDEVRVLTTNSKKDLTDVLKEVSYRYAQEIKAKKLCGFVLKSKSPSCGMERVKLYQKDSFMCEKSATGIFAQALKDTIEYFPMEEEGRLEDAWLRENFIMQIFAYADLMQFMDKEPSMRDLVEFHTSYKYLIYAKSQTSYQLLGQIVANQEKMPLDKILELYRLEFLKAISLKSSISKSYNVLLHIFGYFKNDLESVEKKELLESFEEFKDKIIPLIVPIKMLQLYTHKFNKTYLQKQKFLHPYPSEMKLRSTIEAGK